MNEATLSRLRLLPMTVALAASVLGPSPVSADDGTSAFGCRELQEHATLPSVEGMDGYFFRIAADLRMDHPLTAGTVEQMAAFSTALEERGVALVYVPLPTKSMALPEKLPEDVAIYGYDEVLARQIYDDYVAKLRDAGVTVVDALSALQEDAGSSPPFHQADFHWTPAGAERVARAAATIVKSSQDYERLNHVAFRTEEIGPVTIVSTMRRALQEYCRQSLPMPVASGYRTEEVEQAAGPVDLFGEAAAGANIALVGTSFSASRESHFSGFLAQHGGLAVDNHAVAGGNQFGSIASYVTSRDFAAHPPRFLIWENPIYNNLGQYGPGPMAELIAAARGDCTQIPGNEVVFSNDETLELEISGRELAATAVLLADSGTDRGAKATLRAVFSSGRGLRQTIVRSERTKGTGRFFFPLEAVWSPDLSKIGVSFEGNPSAAATLSICR